MRLGLSGDIRTAVNELAFRGTETTELLKTCHTILSIDTVSKRLFWCSKSGKVFMKHSLSNGMTDVWERDKTVDFQKRTKQPILKQYKITDW